MYDFKFSDIGEGLHEGQILKWSVKVGDHVKEGDTIVFVETDKVNAELPSPTTGIIVKLGPAEGQTIHVGDTIAIIDDGKTSDDTPIKEQVKKEETVAVAEAGASVVGEIQVSSDIIPSDINEESMTQSRRKVLATPVARKMAKDLNIDITLIQGTGENGRIMKDDILNFDATKTQLNYKQDIKENIVISKEGNVEIVQISKLRKAISKQMTISKQVVPHTILSDEIDIESLVTFRKTIKEQAEKQDIKLTYMAFFVKAVAIALKEFPIFNSSFDQENDQIILKKFINVGFAVDTKDGLIVPNIKDADTKTLFQLAKEIKELSLLTNERKVQLPQITNGTFTISNIGSVDLTLGSPVINHPEVAILAVGKISQRPWVINGALGITHTLPLSIAVDHRIIDGADAGRFLIRIKQLLTNPVLLLVS